MKAIPGGNAPSKPTTRSMLWSAGQRTTSTSSHEIPSSLMVALETGRLSVTGCGTIKDCRKDFENFLKKWKRLMLPPENGGPNHEQT